MCFVYRKCLFVFLCIHTNKLKNQRIYCWKLKLFCFLSAISSSNRHCHLVPIRWTNLILCANTEQLLTTFQTTITRKVGWIKTITVLRMKLIYLNDLSKNVKCKHFNPPSKILLSKINVCLWSVHSDWRMGRSIHWVLKKFNLVLKRLSALQW